jgi:alpha-tubulin suppressor-like RCC1 family protein
LTPSLVKWKFEVPASKGLPPGVHVASVAVGGMHTCAALDDGSVRCWGRNDDGMVLPGSTQPQIPSPTVVPGVTHARRVVLDGFDSMAQLDDGSVVTWGRKQNVQTLAIDPVVDLQDGDGFACARRSDGVTSCIEGSSGDRMQASDTTQVAAGSLFACVLHRDGSVACAGVNNHMQLGDGTTTDRSSFAAVKGVTGVTQIVNGYYHACALLADHTVTCWGDIEMTGQGDAMSPPTKIAGLRDVVELTSGPEHVCARKRDNSVACWGFYRHVMQGDRSHWYAAKPVDVPWLRSATMFSNSQLNSCAMLPKGLACWGENSAGQLGDGTMDDHDVAVPVRW